jgi:GAF domain-containing protein
MIEEREGVLTKADSRELHHLGVVDAARALGKGVAPEDAMNAIVDAAIELTHAQQGALLLAKSSSELAVIVVRDAQRVSLPGDCAQISSGVLKRVMGCRSEIIVDETGYDSSKGRKASIARLELHSVEAIPINSLTRVAALDATTTEPPSRLRGILYLNSRWPFFDLDRKVLRMLTREAAVVIENAQLFTVAREKSRLDQEVEITGQVQRHCSLPGFPGSRSSKSLASRSSATPWVVIASMLLNSLAGAMDCSSGTLLAREFRHRYSPACCRV